MSDEPRYIVNIDCSNYRDRMRFHELYDAKVQYDNIISNSMYNDCTVSLWDLVDDIRLFCRTAIEGVYYEN